MPIPNILSDLPPCLSPSQAQYITFEPFETFHCEYSYVESAMLPWFFLQDIANVRGYSIIIVGYMTS